MTLINLEETNKEIGRLAELYAKAQRASDTEIVAATQESAQQLAMAHAEAASAAVLATWATEAASATH